MVTAPKKWRRWCGPRSELVRATDLAADELREWTGLDSKVEVKVEDGSGLTETKPEAAAIMALHPDELRQVASVIVTVKPDREQWWNRREQQRRERRDQGEPPEETEPTFSGAEVSIRVTKYGTALEVDGEERTRVEGLRQRLSTVLDHATSNIGLRDWGPLVAIVLVPAITAGSVVVGGWLGLVQPSPNRAETDEFVALGLGVALALSLAWVVWWLFPPIEMFDEGGAGRARRFRGWIIGVAGTVVVAILGAFIYDQVT